jgi:hypothetical protein
MMLQGKVQTVRFTDFHDLEVTVVDKDVVKPMGGRPQYTCRLVRGMPEIEQLRAMRKQASPQEIEDFKQQIPLPQEDQVLQLVVLDIGGKGQFTRLLCEVVA